MTATFDHLTQYDPEGKTAWYKFPIPIPGDPKLEMVHAGRTNRPYTAEIMKRNAKRASGSRMVNVDSLKEGLADDRELFPKYVIVGWSGVLDAKKKPVKFSKAKCAEFVDSLPDWLFQSVSVFAAQPANFIDTSIPSDSDVAAQAGN